jgi:hypothetical protein
MLVTIKTSKRNPSDIITEISEFNKNYGALCYYEDSQLKSKNENLVTFHFDPIHNVIGINVK